MKAQRRRAVGWSDQEVGRILEKCKEMNERINALKARAEAAEAELVARTQRAIQRFAKLEADKAVLRLRVESAEADAAKEKKARQSYEAMYFGKLRHAQEAEARVRELEARR